MLGNTGIQEMSALEEKWIKSGQSYRRVGDQEIREVKEEERRL